VADTQCSRSSSGFYSLVFVAILAAQSLLGQDKPAGSAPPQAATQQTPDLSVKVQLVTALATVRDKHGQFVRGLAQKDFAITEDGRPQSIRYFSQETDLPLTLGLLVDTSLSQRRVIEAERSASKTFISQMLREGKDTAFVIHFDREVELLQDLTQSRQKLEAALDLLETQQRTGNDQSGGGGSNGGGYPGSRRGGGSRGGGGGYSVGGTLLYDAIYLASDEIMKKQQGRKALIILSDGVDRGSKFMLESAIESAQRADTVVYAILFKDEDEHRDWGRFGGPGMGGGGRHGGGGPPRRREPEEARPDGKKILERISRETGGRLFEVSKKETLEKIYSSIEEELRNQYSLAYTPDRQPAAGYHKISLTTNNKDLKVQTRQGYYADQ
jgi:VWFA-related protein